MSIRAAGSRVLRGLRARILPLLAGGLLAAAAALLVFKETRQAERDWHAVRAQVYDIERAVRRHEVDGYFRTAHESGGISEGADRELLRDLERLSHLDGFAMTEVEIRFERERALVRYRVQGTPRVRDDRPPDAGELVFRKTAGGWRLSASRLSQ